MARKFAHRKKTAPLAPLWKLEDGLTYSSLTSWLECREQFSLKWIDGITPKKVSIPLEFGSVVHYALENQFKGEPREVVHKITDHYRKYRQRTVKNSKEKDTLELILGLANVIFPHYCSYWREDDAKINWIGREEKFQVKHSILFNDNPREIILRGMRDGLYRVKDSFGIFETKTKSRIVDSQIVDQLHYDMQTMLYCFTTYLSTGEFPNQIKYNIIRRPELYRRKSEDLRTYLRRTEEDIIARPDHYFMRYTVSLLQSEIESFVTETLNPILNLFCQWWDSVKKNPTRVGRFQSPYHYLNSNALVGKFGKADMWDAIFGNLQPYTIREEIFPELEDAFQVTWD